VTLAVSVLGVPAAHAESVIGPSEPCDGGDTIENVSSHVSASLPESWIPTGTFSIVDALPPVATGGALGGGGGPLARNSLWK
jgi:hypothetical protein